jgi:hypothetical protein
MAHQQHHKRPLTFRKANNSAPLGQNRPVFEVDFAHFSVIISQNQKTHEFWIETNTISSKTRNWISPSYFETTLFIAYNGTMST